MGRTKGSTVYDYERIRRLHEFGMSNMLIAKRMGCSTRTVTRAIRKATE